MFLETRLGMAIRSLGRAKRVWDQRLRPADWPPVDHSPYRPGYDWLFAFERQLARFLEPWLAARRHALIGPEGLLSEALANAFGHGHGKDPGRTIRVEVFAGELGILVRIRDQGPGFDVGLVRARLEGGRPYFRQAGHGFRRMAETADFGVFFNSTGNAFHLVYLFPPQGLGGGAGTEGPPGGPSKARARAPGNLPEAVQPWIDWVAQWPAPGLPVVVQGAAAAELEALGEALEELARAAERLARRLGGGACRRVHVEAPRANLLGWWSAGRGRRWARTQPGVQPAMITALLGYRQGG